MVRRMFDFLGPGAPATPPLKAIRRYKGESFDYLLTDNPDDLRDAFLRDFPEDAAGIRRCRVTLHSLRSAFATHLFEDDVDIFTIQQLLGHERLETTGRYAVVRTDRIRETPSPLSKLPK